MSDNTSQSGAAGSAGAKSETEAAREGTSKPGPQPGPVKSVANEVAQSVRDEVAGLAQDLQASAKAAASGVTSAVQGEVQAKRQQTSQSVRTATASTIHDTASAVRHREVLPEAALIDKAAGHLDNAAAYVEENDLSVMRADFERLVRGAPLLAVLLALATGFVLGGLLKRG